MSDADPHAVAGGVPLPRDAEEEAALAEEVDLEVDVRRRVLSLHRDLERMDHYAVLGVDRSADRKALKRAYYDLAARLHPDRYFRKKLGSFKVRMETIFARMTVAHDTLTDRERRAEYDAYLDQQHRARGIEEFLADALAEARRAEEKIEREVRTEQLTTAASTAAAAAPGNGRPPGGSAAPTAPAAPATPATTTSSNARPASAPEVAAAARRDALARRLLGGRTMPSPSSPSSAPVASSGQPRAPGPASTATAAPPSTAEAMDALRRRYEERVSHAKAAQARKYVENAQAALAAGDAVAAANAFRVARTLVPSDPDIELRANEAQARADAILAETYSKQAHYEEKNGQWAEAGRSWQRVTKGRPQDAHAHERAAHAMAKAGADLHEASRLAQIAIALDPKNARYRVTLATVYLAAGLELNARRELETAAQLAPHDDTIRAMLKGAGKPA